MAMNGFMLALLITCTLPAPDVLRESCAVTECNSFFSSTDENNIGIPCFCQVIFRDHDGSIIAWRMTQPYARERTADDDREAEINAWQIAQGLEPIPFPCRPKFSQRVPALWPRYDHERKVWVCQWIDGERHRWVESAVMVETHTEFDPEVDERRFFPRELRRELRQR